MNCGPHDQQNQEISTVSIFREHTAAECDEMLSQVRVYISACEMSTKQVRAMANREEKRRAKAEAAYHQLECRAAQWRKAAWRMENGIGLEV